MAGSVPNLPCEKAVRNPSGGWLLFLTDEELAWLPQWALCRWGVEGQTQDLATCLILELGRRFQTGGGWRLLKGESWRPMAPSETRWGFLEGQERQLILFSKSAVDLAADHPQMARLSSYPARSRLLGQALRDQDWLSAWGKAGNTQKVRPPGSGRQGHPLPAFVLDFQKVRNHWRRAGLQIHEVSNQPAPCAKIKELLQK